MQHLAGVGAGKRQGRVHEPLSACRWTLERIGRINRPCMVAQSCRLRPSDALVETEVHSKS